MAEEQLWEKIFEISEAEHSKCQTSLDDKLCKVYWEKTPNFKIITSPPSAVVAMATLAPMPSPSVLLMSYQIIMCA